MNFMIVEFVTNAAGSSVCVHQPTDGFPFVVSTCIPSNGEQLHIKYISDVGLDTTTIDHQWPQPPCLGLTHRRVSHVDWSVRHTRKGIVVMQASPSVAPRSSTCPDFATPSSYQCVDCRLVETEFLKDKSRLAYQAVQADSQDFDPIKTARLARTKVSKYQHPDDDLTKLLTKAVFQSVKSNQSLYPFPCCCRESHYASRHFLS